MKNIFKKLIIYLRIIYKMDLLQQQYSTTPKGKYIKTFEGKNSGYPIDVYYDDTVNGFYFYSSPTGIYQEIYNNIILSKPLIDDCDNELNNLYSQLNLTEQSILNGIKEAVAYAKEHNDE